MHDPQHRLCFDKLIDRVSRKRISRIAYSRSTWHSISKKTFHHWHRILTSNNSIFAIPLFVILFFFLFVFTSREIMQKYFNPYYLISYSLFVYLDTRFFSTSREHLANAPAHRSSFLVPNPILFPRSSEKKKREKKGREKKREKKFSLRRTTRLIFPGHVRVYRVYRLKSDEASIETRRKFHGGSPMARIGESPGWLFHTGRRNPAFFLVQYGGWPDIQLIFVPENRSLLVFLARAPSFFFSRALSPLSASNCTKL